MEEKTSVAYAGLPPPKFTIRSLSATITVIKNGYGDARICFFIDDYKRGCRCRMLAREEMTARKMPYAHDRWPALNGYLRAWLA